MAVTLFKLQPKQRWLGWMAITYAFYVGFGVSITIHCSRISQQAQLSERRLGRLLDKVFCSMKTTPEN
jgi:hypothetical protein